MPVGTSGCARLLRKESSACGEVGWLPTRWVGVEEGGSRKTPRKGGGGRGASSQQLCVWGGGGASWDGRAGLPKQGSSLRRDATAL